MAMVYSLLIEILLSPRDVFFTDCIQQMSLKTMGVDW